MTENRPPDIIRNYPLWLTLSRMDYWEMTRMRNRISGFEYRPVISILVPAYDTVRPWLERALDSVLSQTYPYWELCVADDASTDEYVAETLGLYERLDPRIKVKHSAENRGISGATNNALYLATGEFIGLLDHDDELSPNALFEVVKLLQEQPDADLIYSDEDKIDGEGKRKGPLVKIGFSPDLALSCNYMNHFSVYRRNILEEVGGWREGFEGAQDLDLVQRFTERTDRVFHIPKTLYHWREVSGSTAVGAESKPYTHERARQAFKDALGRRGIAGSVKNGFAPNTFRVDREISGKPSVSVIVFSSRESPESCVESLRQHTSYPNYQILVLDVESGSVSELLNSGKQKEVERLDTPTLTRLYNSAVRRSGGEYVLLLDSSLEASEGWLESLLQHAQRSEVGAVGGKIVSPSEEVLQAGLILDGGASNGSARFYHPLNRSAVGFRHLWDLNRNCSALSSECIMFRTSAFEKVGGFDEAHFEAEFADVDLSLRLREEGYLMVCTPYATFTRRGSAPQPRELSPNESDYARERWANVLGADPYHNPNLSWKPGEQLPQGQPRTPALQPPDEPQAENRVPRVVPNREMEGMPPPFFIVGHGRSGTTWLEMTLNSHPEIACKGEGMFFGRGRKLHEGHKTLPEALAESESLRLWHEMKTNRWDRRSFEEALPGMVRVLIDHVIGSELESSGKKIAGDKTPHHVSHLEEIHEFYPEAKIIHLIRDGRDVAISNLHTSWQNARDMGGPIDLDSESLRRRDAYLEDRESFLAREESIFTEQRIRQLSSSWNRVVHKGREDGRRLFGNNYLELHYEDLLAKPHTTLQRLFGFLRASVDDSIVEQIIEANRFEKVTGRKSGEEDSAAFHRKGVAGDWKEVFTKRDSRIYKEEAGELLVELGYEEDNRW